MAMADFCSQGLASFCYLFLSLLLSLTTEWSLAVFPYPVLLSACHLAIIMMLLLPALLWTKCVQSQIGVFRRHWKEICILGIASGLSISLNTAASQDVSASTSQAVRSLLPLLTALTALSVEGRRSGPLEMSAVACLSGGMMAVVWQGGSAGAVPAKISCILAALCSSLMTCYSGRLLSLDVRPGQLICLAAPVSLLVLMPYLIYTEMPLFVTGLAAMDAESHFHSTIISILVGTSVVALAYYYSLAHLIRLTSSVSAAVIGQIRLLGLVILSAALLGHNSFYTARMGCGSLLTFAGFLVYPLTRIFGRQQLQDSPSPPTNIALKQSLLDPCGVSKV